MKEVIEHVSGLPLLGFSYTRVCFLYSMPPKRRSATLSTEYIKKQASKSAELELNELISGPSSAGQLPNKPPGVCGSLPPVQEPPVQEPSVQEPSVQEPRVQEPADGGQTEERGGSALLSDPNFIVWLQQMELVSTQQELEEIADKEDGYPLTDDIDSDSGTSDGEEDKCDSVPDQEEDDNTVKDFLQGWSCKFNIAQNATSSLLSFFKSYFPSLPCDARTLKGTPRSTNITILSNGQYAHLGLKDGLMGKMQQGFKKNCDKIEIDVFVGGVKIYNSVNEECWPIMARCRDLNDSRPYIVGLFYGSGKPKTIEEFLADYIDEVLELQANGLNVEGKHYGFGVRLYIADAPARAYLKCVTGHTSKHACERCDQCGDYVGMVVLADHVGPARTDESFNSRRDPEHHTGNSPLEVLGTGFISQFVYDPMRMVDFGVFKRFLHYILYKGPLPARLNGFYIQIFADLLVFYGDYLPLELSNRKPTLERMSKWKSIEYRLILLYLGPVILKSVLNQTNMKDQVYKLYLLLHVSIFILSSDVLLQVYLKEARTFLELFVKYSSQVLSKKFVVYNVHSILHLVDDVEKFRNLMSFSAYPFEDKGGSLKKLVKSSSKPLQQIHRRLVEREKN